MKATNGWNGPIRIAAWALVCALPFAAAWAEDSDSDGDVLTVVGQNDPTSDRQNIQDALDNAGDGDTVVLVGVFQLDGQLIAVPEVDNLTIRGASAAPDGDDDSDSGGDSDSDSDSEAEGEACAAELRGLTLPDGFPADGGGPSLFNRGLVTMGLVGTQKNLTIEGITFRDLNRGIVLAPDFLVSEGLFCDDFAFTGGRVQKAVIRDNCFDNTTRGFEIFGATRDVRVVDNDFSNSRKWGVLLVGKVSGCVGDPGSFPIGMPVKTTVAGNTFVGPVEAVGLNVALGATGTERTGVEHNAIVATRPDGFEEGLFIDDDLNGRYRRNAVRGADIAIEGNGPAPGTRIERNSIVDSLFNGIAFFGGASDYLARRNAITGSGAEDYFLDETTMNNTVILEPGQTVTDLGTGNDVQ